jgi:hypothetical protein
MEFTAALQLLCPETLNAKWILHQEESTLHYGLKRLH